LSSEIYIFEMENRNKIITHLNSKRIEIDGENAFMPLAYYLRENLCLTGTKVVCAEGDCGACTVLLAREIGGDGKPLFKAVNSCIIPLYLVDGAQIVSVEGLKNENGELHPAQKAMVDCHGAQCGYCTPGFICAMAGLAEKVKNEHGVITEKKAKNYLTGNLCRCTGYKPIIEAAVNIDLEKVELLKERFYSPEWLAEMRHIKSTPLVMNFKEKAIFLPVNLDHALKVKNEYSELKIIAGSTDLGVVVNKGKVTTPKAMGLYHIQELKRISQDEQFIYVGAMVTLSELEDFIESTIPEFKKLLHVFASPQIKNQATLVGNVVNGSPIADTIPFLMAADAVVVLKSINGTREVLMRDFYLGYKKINIEINEIVVSIKIPKLKKVQKAQLYKVSMRKDLDISAATFAGIIEIEQNKIKNACFALGGVAATVIRLNEIEKMAIGADFSRKTFEELANKLPEIISPLSDLRASKEYRMKLVQNYFLKFYDELSKGEI
jgi:xanthine dehydrogenase small subunit